MKIAFCAAEAFPFAKTGGLADVCGTLPLALEKIGIEPLVFLPRYQGIEKGLVTTTIGRRVKVYFIENDAFFNRAGLYGDSAGDYPDNLERFQYFCEATLNFLKQKNLKTDILHCHDWHTALIPVYLKERYAGDSFFHGTKTVLTIHNLAFQGVFDKTEYPKIGLPERLFNIEGFEFFGQVNILKAGLIYADKVTTVSPTYAKEIQTEKFGCGLDGLLRSRHAGLTGILNGMDYTHWNPRTDRLIKKRYSSRDAAVAKRQNKTWLQKKLKLTVDKNIPLFGFVGRLFSQKGVELLAKSLKDIIGQDAQVVIQGLGDKRYCRLLRKIADTHPRCCAVRFIFDEPLAHQIYAGADFFLVPSVFEPCGLGQMISMAYGTIPIVFKTGGLADTVEPFDPQKHSGNGFVFERYGKRDFLKVIRSALDLYQDKGQFSRLMHNALKADFSWDRSAREYKKVYQCLLSA